MSHNAVCPEILVNALRYDLVRNGETDIGHGLFLLFQGYLRLGDLLQLLLGDIVFQGFSSPISRYAKTNGIMGKGGGNETVTIRLQFIAFLLI